MLFINGPEFLICRFKVTVNDTINNVKAQIQALTRSDELEEGIPPNQQRLIFNGKELDPWVHVSAYGICKDSELYLVTLPNNQSIKSTSNQ